MLKFYNIETMESMVVLFMEVPSINWLELNIDSATRSCPSLAL